MAAQVSMGVGRFVVKLITYIIDCHYPAFHKYMLVRIIWMIMMMLAAHSPNGSYIYCVLMRVHVHILLL